MLQKNEPAFTIAKPTIIIVVAAIVAMIVSASIVSIAGAKCPAHNGATGTIASIQDGKNGSRNGYFQVHGTLRI